MLEKKGLRYKNLRKKCLCEWVNDTSYIKRFRAAVTALCVLMMA